MLYHIEDAHNIFAVLMSSYGIQSESVKGPGLESTLFKYFLIHL